MAVLLLHALALDAAEPARRDPTRAAAPAPLSVRMIDFAADPVAYVDVAAGMTSPSLPISEAAPPPKPHRVQRAAARVRLESIADASPLATLALAEAQSPPSPTRTPPEPTERLGDPAAASPPPNADAAVAAPATAASTPIAPETPIPVYKTRLAPATTLHYELRRGGISGNGELQWKLQDKAYELRLEGKVAGITLLTQVSQGLIDANGLAPVRFTDQRTRRAAQAANFQRDRGVITFSGPPDQYKVVPGVQDRLSWMLQLGAIVAAEPSRAKPGQKVVLYVVGSRGEVDTWVLDYIGVESVQAAGSIVKAVRFTREARKPMDSQIEIWLDPARHYLPVHAKQSNGAENSGDVFELLLKEADPIR